MTEVYTLYKIVNILVWTVLFAFGYYAFHSRLSYSFDAAESKTDSSVVGYSKVKFRFVDVGTLYIDFHRLALFHEFFHIFDGILVAGEVGSHIFGGIVCFEIACLVCHPSVACCVRFVERI